MLRLLSVKRASSHQKLQQIERVQSELSLLFETVQQRKALSETLRVFPLYFNTSYIEQFCKSSNIWQYLKYINHRKVDRTQVKHVKQYFQSHGVSKVKLNGLNMIYLEAYLDWLIHQCQSFNQTQNQYLMEFINLERPEKWFQQEEKTEPRVFIYHHGPTNSGKSTSAIEDLKNLGPHQLGIYMAPLRLLAWEYQQKLGNCTLITGQQKEFKNSNLISCTIEAAPLKDDYQVAVIDQIQMIGDPERGWAWTKAILATRAKRIHLCGDERALGIVSKLVQLTGDVLEERRYSRLSKLILIHKLFKLEKLEPGDCIINFSMKKLIKHRNDINKMLHLKNKVDLPPKEENTSEDKDAKQEATDNYPNRSAIIYGKLPPQCRKQQATAFNNNAYPYLVATNAIGMGLNLNIKKIILMDYQRQTSDGSREDLEEHQIQQIAGRAGRGKQTGYVQCANQQTLQRVQSALATVNKTYGIQLQNLKQDNNEAQSVELQDCFIHRRSRARDQLYNHLLKRQMTEQQFQIKKACFYFTSEYITDFKVTLQHIVKVDLSISETIEFISSFCQLSHSYFLQQTSNLKYIVNLLQNKKMDIKDLLIFYNGLELSKPAFRSKKKSHERYVAKQIEQAHRSIIKNFIEYRRVPLPSFLVANYEDNYSKYKYMDQISQLQFHYNLLQSYVWLWNKYEFAFYQVRLAIKIKERLSEKINQVLMDNLFMVPEGEAKNKEKELSDYPSFEEARTMRRMKSNRPNKKNEAKFIAQLKLKKEQRQQGILHHHHRAEHHLSQQSKQSKLFQEIEPGQSQQSGVIAQPRQNAQSNLPTSLESDKKKAKSQLKSKEASIDKNQ